MIGTNAEIRQSLMSAQELPVTVFLRHQDLSNQVDGEAPSVLFWVVTTTTNSGDFSAIQGMRVRWPSCAIMILGDSYAAQELVMEAMHAGATDFLFTPINPAEISMRLRLSKAKAAGLCDMNTIRFGDILLDTIHNKLSGPGGTRSVSSIETALLTILIHSSAEHPVNKRELKQRCWQAGAVTDNALHRKLFAVRQLLQEISNTVVIRTKYRVGFYLRSIHVPLKIAS